MWREGDARDAVAGHDRYTLPPGPQLAIWTTPPGRNELQAALQRTRPSVVYLFGIDPQAVGLEAFLQRLAGLAKHTANTASGQTTVAALAAAMAQRESTVRLGLDWLEERGHVAVSYRRPDGGLRLTPGSGVSGPRLPRIAAQLKVALDEAAAYRAFFGRGAAQSLIE